MRKKETTPTAYQKNALYFLLILVLLTAACVLWIGLKSHRETAITADIYQDGQLLRHIDLSSVEEPYTFTVSSSDGGVNVIEVRPGSIGIISADCPDKLCVHQGFIHNSILPITCLPNRLVIQVNDTSYSQGFPGGEDSITPDIITY